MAEGDIPIGLVAHMDTVFPIPADEVFYDREKNVMWSPEGLGADDRAGVFIILQIIRKGLRPHIILTTDEEIGCVGASAVIEDYPNHPFKELNYLIQLDRRGSNDCVFYDCDNRDFVKYIESFGFVETIGTFSDISIICPDWQVAGVNLSVGYRDEHSTSEILYIQSLKRTLNRTIKMLLDKKSKAYEFVPSAFYQYYSRYDKKFQSIVPYNNDFFYQVKCQGCGKVHSELDTLPIKLLDGGTGFMCSDCISKDSVSWCQNCYEAFENGGDQDQPFCKDCRGGNIE